MIKPRGPRRCEHEPRACHHKVDRRINESESPPTEWPWSKTLQSTLQQAWIVPANRVEPVHPRRIGGMDAFNITTDQLTRDPGGIDPMPPNLDGAHPDRIEDHVGPAVPVGGSLADSKNGKGLFRREPRGSVRIFNRNVPGGRRRGVSAGQPQDQQHPERWREISRPTIRLLDEPAAKSGHE